MDSEFSCVMSEEGVYPPTSNCQESRLLQGAGIPWPFRPALCAGRGGLQGSEKALEDRSQAVQLKIGEKLLSVKDT